MCSVRHGSVVARALLVGVALLMGVVQFNTRRGHIVQLSQNNAAVEVRVQQRDGWDLACEKPATHLRGMVMGVVMQEQL